MEKIAASFGSSDTSGKPWPFSHLLTACGVMPSSVASASCVMLCSRRSAPIRSPSVFGSIRKPPCNLYPHYPGGKRGKSKQEMVELTQISLNRRLSRAV
jgi:hypothetical protein